MSTLPILQADNEFLRKVALPVPKELFGTPELAEIIQNMADTLDTQSDGVALAAPQVGIPYRIFIMRHDRTFPTPAEGEPIPEADVRVFINPKFVRSSRRRSEVDEGCLSVRGLYGTTLRNDRATVRAQDVHGAVFERGGGGLIAQIYQHEIDHLEGILFIDHAVDIVNVAEIKAKRERELAEESENEKDDHE